MISPWSSACVTAVAIMYLGRIVETGSARAIFKTRVIPIRRRCSPRRRDWSRDGSCAAGARGRAAEPALCPRAAPSAPAAPMPRHLCRGRADARANRRPTGGCLLALARDCHAAGGGPTGWEFSHEGCLLARLRRRPRGLRSGRAAGSRTWSRRGGASRSDTPASIRRTATAAAVAAIGPAIR